MQRRVCSSIKFYILFSLKTKCFLKLEKQLLRYVLCVNYYETIMHLFYDCLIVKNIWNQPKAILSNNLIFAISTPQKAIFGFWDLDMNKHLILNHLLFIFKMRIYNARTAGYLNISHMLIYINDIKGTKKKLCENDAKRRKIFNKKWKNVLIKCFF